VQRIRDAQVAEEIAAQAGTEGTPDLHLSDFLQPVIFGPQRPPLARSGYFPGIVGVASGAVALNTSHAGVFVSETNSDSIVRVNSITIFNETVLIAGYEFRRLDDATGFTIVPLIPGYVNAGTPATGGIFSAVRSNTVAAQGVLMGQVVLEPSTNVQFDGPWIINAGALVVNPTLVNSSMRVYMNWELWPAIRAQ